MVRPDKIPPQLSQPIERQDSGRATWTDLRKSGLLKAALINKATELGFCECKIAKADALPEAKQRLATWLEAGYAGDMHWMAQSLDRRSSPKALWPQVQSIIILAMNYGPEGDALAGLANEAAGNISVYARHRDYHDVIKGKLKVLGQWLASQSPAGTAIKVFVDTAPVLEKPLAASAGIGWQGKHTNLVSRQKGSWLFLGSIFTTLEMEADASETDHCGNCRACLDACPTNAFPAPYQLDARRCISYLTIEHKGHIASQFRAAIGNRIYGCDDCLAVCPWNKFAKQAAELKLQARADMREPSLAFLSSLDDIGFRSFFAGGPVKRIGHARFLRNVLIAIGNSGRSDHIKLAKPHLENASPLVRAMAIWALRRLLQRDQFQALAEKRWQTETDMDVQQEWEAGMEARN